MPFSQHLLHAKSPLKVTAGEDDPLLRQQVQLANQLSLLQQLTTQTSGQSSAATGDTKGSASSSEPATGATVTSTTAQVGGAFTSPHFY